MSPRVRVSALAPVWCVAAGCTCKVAGGMRKAVRGGGTEGCQGILCAWTPPALRWRWGGDAACTLGGWTVGLCPREEHRVREMPSIVRGLLTNLPILPPKRGCVSTLFIGRQRGTASHWEILSFSRLVGSTTSLAKMVWNKRCHFRCVNMCQAHGEWSPDTIAHRCVGYPV